MVMSLCGSATIMEVGVRERLPALWRRIEDAHYSYLETDDSPEKLQQKKKLEGFIMEYLSLVPHECKFGLAETTKVFQRTLSELSEFSAYRAGIGWEALARYAANLLSQPWRKEYKVIRLYCGFFKHEVEANLVGADTILRAMGYKPVGGGRLALDAPVCPDMVTAISRDALIAQCECQIMAHIWESYWSSGTRVTWAEVARARASRAAGLPPAAGNHLAYMPDSKIYSNVPEIISSDQQYCTRNDARFQPTVPHYNHIYSDEQIIEEPTPVIHSHYVIPSSTIPQQMMYQIPTQHMHGDIPVTIPQCGTMPMTSAYGPVPYFYPMPTPYMIPTPVYPPIKHATNIPVNGYPAVPQYQYPSVPTAKLIELDTSSYENGKLERFKDDRNQKKSARLAESSRRCSTSKSGFSDVSLPSLPRSDTQPTLSKAKEDGMGTYESWDYVFRNLSSKDHDADTRSRLSPSLDRDSRTLDRLDREDRKPKYQPTTLDLEDGLQALNIDRSHDENAYRTAKVNESLMRLKQEQELKRSKQLAKKIDERKTKKVMEPVPNPKSDALVNNKIAQDKVRLLTKKDVKDRKEVIKQQNGIVAQIADIKKVKKTSRSNVSDCEKPTKSRIVENGVNNSSQSSKISAPPSHNYDIKAQLIVSLDEADSIQRSPPKRSHQNGDRERSTSMTSSIHDRVRQDTGDNSSKSKWECGTCTYLNKDSAIACEMCGKSKRGPEIQPLTSGGRECPACTLVNQRDATICDACGTSLEHCPTYI